MTRTTLGCLLKGHVYDDEWTLRPAWVGAGISLDAVHFDRKCTRCGHLDSVWSQIEGERAAPREPTRLSDWLTGNKATVTWPDGTVRLPEGGEWWRPLRAGRTLSAKEMRDL